MPNHGVSPTVPHCVGHSPFMRQERSLKVKVKLRLTVSQSVCLGVEPNLGLLTRGFFFQSYCLVFFWGALSDERSGLSCVSLCH
jgi:hypothetical protein